MAARPNAEFRFLYLTSNLRSGGFGSEPRLAQLSGREKTSLRPVISGPIDDPLGPVNDREVDGVVISMSTGLPDLEQLRLAEAILGLRSRVWFYWPGESAVESVDRDRIRSHMRHFMAAKVWETIRPAARIAYSLMSRLRSAAGPTNDDAAFKKCVEELQQIINNAKPVQFTLDAVPSPSSPLSGTGFYLRTDYWAPLTSGGSYGHTCYLARSLARTVKELICLVPSDYPLLRELGLGQVVMPSPAVYSGEKDLLTANSYYYQLLQRAVEVVKPTFIYERLCLGNYTAARLSLEHQIPYVLEYNGSEIEMSRTFEGHRFQYEAIFEKAEDAAFRQATLISVVSDALKDDLIARGVPSFKILVNPNAVDSEEYAPPSAQERGEIRQQLGFADSNTVVGFSGTFGGWHGIDVLAEAIPQICKQNCDVRFLLIGDGSYKHLIESAVKLHGLTQQVVSTGRVPQREGARLLKACDIFVSPHSRVMSSGRFFGSPTKLFEYMAMGRGIVASDLDQIGEILSPALRAATLNGMTPVQDERAILCRPGDITDFTRAVEYLVRNPDTTNRLGRNARNIAIADHTWDSHITRLWRCLARIVPEPREVTVTLPSTQNSSSHAQDIQHSWTSHLTSCEAHKVELRTYIAKTSGSLVGRELGRDILDSPQCHKHLDGQEEFALIHSSDLPYISTPEQFLAGMSQLVERQGRAIVAAFNENSYRHWMVQFLRMGMIGGLLNQFSMSEIIAREYAGSSLGSEGTAVRIYTREELVRLFRRYFGKVHFYRRHFLDWTVIIDASKPYKKS